LTFLLKNLDITTKVSNSYMGATTFSTTALSIIALSIKVLFAMLSINDF
jgi:hypothetical protein